MAVRVHRHWSVVFLKILLYIILFSQTCVFGVLIVESMLPFIDVVFNHLFTFVIKPYLNWIWTKLFNWICVYITVPTLVLTLRKFEIDRRNGEIRASESE